MNIRSVIRQAGCIAAPRCIGFADSIADSAASWNQDYDCFGLVAQHFGTMRATRTPTWILAVVTHRDICSLFGSSSSSCIACSTFCFGDLTRGRIENGEYALLHLEFYPCSPALLFGCHRLPFYPCELLMARPSANWMGPQSNLSWGQGGSRC